MELDEVLSTFIVETSKENCEKYSMHMLTSGLHRYASLLHPNVDIPQFHSSKFIYLLPPTNKCPGQFIEWAG